MDTIVAANRDSTPAFFWGVTHRPAVYFSKNSRTERQSRIRYTGIFEELSLPPVFAELSTKAVFPDKKAFEPMKKAPPAKKQNVAIDGQCHAKMHGHISISQSASKFQEKSQDKKGLGPPFRTREFSLENADFQFEKCPTIL